jgi:hypothetical protein
MLRYLAGAIVGTATVVLFVLWFEAAFGWPEDWNGRRGLPEDWAPWSGRPSQVPDID